MKKWLAYRLLNIAGRLLLRRCVILTHMHGFIVRIELVRTDYGAKRMAEICPACTKAYEQAKRLENKR
jgi:hypothetical protein